MEIKEKEKKIGGREHFREWSTLIDLPQKSTSIKTIIQPARAR